ncbi:MAG: hypothetical protein ACR2MS_02480, partial [Weeksellaceae bacterium]
MKSYIYPFHTLKALCGLFLILASSLVFSQEDDELLFPFQDQQTGGLYLDSPLKYNATFDALSGMYILREQVGGISYGEPIYLSQKEYFDLLLSNSVIDYYKDKSQALDNQYRGIRSGKDNAEDQSDGLVLPSLQVKNKMFQTIFGGDKIELIPSGYASIDLG